MEEKVPPTNVNTESFTTDYYASLLVGLIHKLNNVITVLTGHFGLMLLDPDLKPDILQPLQQMYRAALLVSQCLNEAASMGRATPLASWSRSDYLSFYRRWTVLPDWRWSKSTMRDQDSCGSPERRRKSSSNFFGTPAKRTRKLWS